MAVYLSNKSTLTAQRSLSKATSRVNTSYERLSSGLRINSAKDDAAGLILSDQLTSQINGLTQGNRNANDGISLCQVADGAMSEVVDVIQRLRTLAIQSANGTNSTSEREALQQETNQLCQEVDSIAKWTSFGESINPLDGSHSSFSFQVGANANQTVNMSLNAITFSDLLTNATNKGNTVSLNDDFYVDAANGVKSISIKTSEDAQNAISVYDSMISMVDTNRATCGAISSRLEYTVSYQENTIENLSDARSRIRDVDYASEVAELASANILEQISASILQKSMSQNIILQLLG